MSTEVAIQGAGTPEPNLTGTLTLALGAGHPDDRTGRTASWGD